MALRTLMLNKRKKEKELALEQLRAQKAEFATRTTELEKALDEAKTDEEIAAVAAEADKLEAEMGEANVDQQIADAEGEIAGIDAELQEEEEKANRAAGAAGNKNSKKEYNAMSNRTIFGSLTPERRAAIMQDTEFRSFLADAKKQIENRGVNGAELTIPTIALPLIRENVGKYSILYDYVNVQRVGGKSRQNILSTVGEAVWTEAVANFNEGSLTINQIEIDGYKVGCFFAIPNAILEDSEENLAEILIEYIARGIGKALDKAILFGTGVRMPIGVLSRLAQTAQPSDWGANAPAWTDLHTSNVKTLNIADKSGTEFFAALAVAFSAATGKWSPSRKRICIMNEKTKADVMAKSLQSSAAGAIVAGINAVMPGFGGEIVECDLVADYDIVFGYFDTYTLAERAGTTIKSSEHVRMLQDQTVFVGSARYDGQPVFGEAFGVVNYNNTAPTTSAIFAADEANVDLVKLNSLVLGPANSPVALTPAFDPDVLNYSATVTSHTTKVTAEVKTSGAAVVIKNGDTTVTNGGNATTTAGNNVLTFEVTNGNAAKRTYTVTISDETT